jgi:hypothetical protein
MRPFTVGPSGRDLRGVRVTLAVVLAWPWSLALSAAESVCETRAEVVHARLDAPASHLQPTRSGAHLAARSGADVALAAYDAEEEDQREPTVALPPLLPADGPVFTRSAVNASLELFQRSDSPRLPRRSPLRC